MEQRNYTVEQLRQACQEANIELIVLDEGYRLESGDDAMYFSKDQMGINEAMDIVKQQREAMKDTSCN